MLSKLNVFEIRRDALIAVKDNANIFSFWVVYYILPILIASSLHYIEYDVDTRLFGNLISGISLFAGLLFSIIFIVSNNLNTRREQLKTKDEENIRYIETYKKFAKNIVSLISYTVVKAIFIIIILIISDAVYSYLDNKVNLFLRLLWDVLVVFLYHFIFYIILILKEMYSMQYEDISKK
jgi:hypothetical protein